MFSNSNRDSSKDGDQHPLASKIEKQLRTIEGRYARHILIMCVPKIYHSARIRVLEMQEVSLLLWCSSTKILGNL